MKAPSRWLAHTSLLCWAGNVPPAGLWAMVGLSLLLFCGWGAWVLRKEEVQDLLHPAPLPSYRLEILLPHDPQQEDPGITRLPMSGTLALTLRPATRVSGPVAVRALLYIVQDGVEVPWPVQLAAAPTGTFRLRAPLAALPGLRPGRCEIRFLLSRPSSPQDVQILRATLDLLPG